MPLKHVAIFGDTHANQSNRFEEHNRIMTWIANDAAERECSLAVHTGDVWEKTSTVDERLAVADYSRLIARHMPFLAIPGNHDNWGDIEWLGRLRGHHPIVTMLRPDVVELGGFNIACLPWPRKAWLLAALGIDSREAGDQAAVTGLRDVLRGLGAMLAERSGPSLLAAHCMLRGSRTTMSQPPLTGCDMEIGLEDLALVRAAFYALGHIHLGEGNEWEVDGSPAAFPGAPWRCNHGEAERKGYIVASFDGNRCVSWERIETPCTPMVHISATWVDGTLAHDFRPGDAKGADVRLRYTTAHDQRDAAAVAAATLADALRADGAIALKVEPLVITEQRARAPELAKAVTLDEKLEALWRAKSFDPGARRAALLAKVHLLEEVARAS